MKKTVLVTGCSAGLGRELAERLALQGQRVVATMRGTEGKNAAVANELRATAAEEGLDLSVLELDVTVPSSVDAAAARVLADAGAPDVVVNNAGQMFVGLTEAFSCEELAQQLEINVVGVHRVNRAFLPSMRARGDGLIVNVSSVAGRMSVPFFGVYHASKWALEGYSEALRAELASSGIDLVLVQPGPFTTSLFPNSPNPADAEGRAATYPAVVQQTFEEMGQAFEGMFEDPATPPGTRLVVDRIMELIEAPPGTRPLRNVVGVDFGIGEMNVVAAPIQAGLIEGMGLTSFATLAPRPRT